MEPLELKEEEIDEEEDEVQEVMDTGEGEGNIQKPVNYCKSVSCNCQLSL